MIVICVGFLMQVQKFKKFKSPFISLEWHKTWKIGKKFSTAIPQAFSVKSLVNFDPLTTMYEMWVWTHLNQLFCLKNGILAFAALWNFYTCSRLNDHVLLVHTSSGMGSPTIFHKRGQKLPPNFAYTRSWLWR